MNKKKKTLVQHSSS